MRKDYAISSKPIPETVWVLIFTSSGKYFFFNSKTGERCWIPPESVVRTLKEKLNASPKMEMEMFFDPFYQGEESECDSENNEIDNEDEDESESDLANSEDSNISDIVTDNHRPKSNNDHSEDEFKLYLLKNSVDPFAPWPTILSLHSSSPQFQSIASDKRRQELFAQVCPVLIEQKREEGRKKKAEAEKWWDEVKGEYLKMGWQWFQVIKKVKGNSKFSLLNEKECEKEYKNLLNKRK